MGAAKVAVPTLSLSYLPPRLLLPVCSEDTPRKTKNNHNHSLVYKVICFMSSGMSKTILLTAFFAVTSSVRAQGTQWYVSVRREDLYEYMLITSRLQRSRYGTLPDHSPLLVSTPLSGRYQTLKNRHSSEFGFCGTKTVRSCPIAAPRGLANFSH